jgi:hypothetical protein
MALLFSYSGRIEVHGLHDPKAALLKIEHGLDGLRARRAVLVGQQIQFSAGTAQNLFGRTALGTAGSGQISAQQSKALFMISFMSVPVLGAPNLSPEEATAHLVGFLGMRIWRSDSDNTFQVPSMAWSHSRGFLKGLSGGFPLPLASFVRPLRAARPEVSYTEGVRDFQFLWCRRSREASRLRRFPTLFFLP